MAKPTGIKRKVWSEESMKAAVKNVLRDDEGIRETSRLYNIPFQASWRII